MSVLGRRGRLQFLSEEDAAAAFCRALEAADLRGAFNVVPEDSVALDEICRRLGKWRLPVPLIPLWLGLFLGRRLLGTTIPEGVAPYLAYPVVASSQKTKETLGFSAKQSSLEALLACANSIQTTS
jgi:nucleoside-diphosphate-sugar epimerase